MGWLSDLLKEYPALSVAKERLALAEDRFKHTEEENTKLKARILQLEVENENIKSQLPNDTTGTLDEIEVNILKLLTNAGEDGVSIAAISQNLGINATKVEYHAERIANEEYIYQTYIMNMPVTYNLDQKGREYLVKNGHL